MLPPQRPSVTVLVAESARCRCRFGKSRREAEDFVQSFEEVFFMQRRRVMGDNIRIFKCYGSNWQVGRGPSRPSYPHPSMRCNAINCFTSQ